jgi:septum site-determining protein MinC
MTLIRGRRLGLELRFAGLDFDAALAELSTKLSERPGFYRGSSATAVVDDPPPDDEGLERLRALLEEHGIELSGVEPAGETEELERRRAMRPRRELKLSESARSLVADFAGARADIADRRKRGESSVRRVVHQESKPETAAGAAQTPPLYVASPPPGTLYHVGTLRGGQALHHVGNIVVVGDVNPGTELVATGDILVFGRLLGVAHAGAQGDESAKVYALHLQATQLRIATSIALDEDTRASVSQPEIAFLRDGRIIIAPFSKASEVLK